MTSSNNNNMNEILIAVASSTNVSLQKVNNDAIGNIIINNSNNINNNHSTSFLLTADEMLMNEEEKMMLLMNNEEEEDDEEVTSVESNGDMEESMMTMAVLNSLVDHPVVAPSLMDKDDNEYDDDDKDADDEDDDDTESNHRSSSGGDPKPDAAPSSLVKTTCRRGRRKRVRDSNDNSSSSTLMKGVQLIPKDPPLLSRPMGRPTALPALKPSVTLGSAEIRLDNGSNCSGEQPPLGDNSNNDLLLKKKVNFSDPLETSLGTGRIRGFSIDLDLGLEFSDMPSETDTAGTLGSRKRAFSFECFAFGICADEPLPMLEDSGGSILEGEIPTARIRSDSIVFDPSSFHEGGIFEQAALFQDIKPTPPPPPAPISRLNNRKSRPNTGGGGGGEGVTAFNANVSVGIIPSINTPFPMELLNKDGRIGIYLPEARKARIARFHAKRSKRVWRKRIKYDCRKKLADSRPRVKGRFVKRVD